MHHSNVFISEDLVHGYLQLAVTEDDIKKTAFRASSSGLYKFTHMIFGLSKARSGLCRLMKQCLGDQQFITLLLYLDYICIFVPDVSNMLDIIELGFNWLKSFNIKIKPKSAIFSDQHDFSEPHLVSEENVSQPGEGWQSKRLACAKECQGTTFIPRLGILLLLVYSQLCLCGNVSSSVDRSNKCQED